MGLDWRPMGKPKPGYEDRFNQIFRILEGSEKPTEIPGQQLPSREELLKEWFEIQIRSYETIKAPMVGRDPEANDWALELYNNSDKSQSQEDYVKELAGYYVIELAKELDGVPVYMSFGQDRNVFRGQFLADCEEVVDVSLLVEGWRTKAAKETLEFGNQLMAAADKLAAENNLQHLKERRSPPEQGDNPLANKIHILYAAAKWLIFYGKNGHGFEADY